VPLPAAGVAIIVSVAVLSPTDVWMLVREAAGPHVYHLADGTWENLPIPAGNDINFGGVSIVASSDANVWVVGDGDGGGDTWRYDGSTWTEHVKPSSLVALFYAAALGTDGTLYLAGSSVRTGEGGVWSFDGAQWTDLTPATNPATYDALAVTADGGLIAGGFGTGNSTFSYKSGQG